MNFLGGAEFLLWQGFLVTMQISSVALVASCIVGLVLGVPAATDNKVVQAVTRVYIELWRGLPQLITMFMVFFILPKLGLNLSPVVSGIVGLTLWGSANFAEIVRGGIKSIKVGQQDAAKSLGFTWFQQMWLVIGPQALRRVIPPSLGLAAAIIQGSTIASLIGAADIIVQAHRSTARLLFSEGTGYSMPIMLTVMFAFFIICYPLMLMGRYAEHRMALTQLGEAPKKRGLVKLVADMTKQPSKE
jgi:polar amino acid transport system permease protein